MTRNFSISEAETLLSNPLLLHVLSELEKAAVEATLIAAPDDDRMRLMAATRIKSYRSVLQGIQALAEPDAEPEEAANWRLS